jgi:hypothetical protein
LNCFICKQGIKTELQARQDRRGKHVRTGHEARKVVHTWYTKIGHIRLERGLAQGWQQAFALL